jgi:Arc/MetJ-type ribon-helix-helix transcriptional regulator
MKIVTVNVPESYIEAIEKLIGENGLYPSRSELIRCAVREFLLKELQMASRLKRSNNPNRSEDFDEENFVRVPVEDKEGKEPVTEFKTYKIIKRLEH